MPHEKFKNECDSGCPRFCASTSSTAQLLDGFPTKDSYGSLSLEFDIKVRARLSTPLPSASFLLGRFFFQQRLPDGDPCLQRKIDTLRGCATRHHGLHDRRISVFLSSVSPRDHNAPVPNFSCVFGVHALFRWAIRAIQQLIAADLVFQSASTVPIQVIIIEPSCFSSGETKDGLLGGQRCNHCNLR